jgi:hypothetical protein
MQLPPAQAGGQVLGNTFIDGAHMVLAGPARDNYVFCTRILKLMSSSCFTLPNVYALTYTIISTKRITSHAGVVRQSLAPSLTPMRDSKQ